MAVDEPTEQEIFESNMRAEQEKWRVLGISPDNMLPEGGTIGIGTKLDLLVDLVIEKELISQDAWVRAFNERFLETLRLCREELEPQIAAQKLEAIKQGKLHRGHLH